MDSVWDRLRCDWCGAAAQPEHIDIERSHLFCPFCEGITPLKQAPDPIESDLLTAAPTPDDEPTETPSKPTPEPGMFAQQPSNLTVNEHVNGIEIRYLANRKRHLTFLLLAGLMEVVQIGIALWFGAFFFAAFLAIAFWIYYLVVRIKNRSILNVKRDSISFKTLPMPWFSQSTLHRPQQLWVRRNPRGTTNSAVTYTLMATSHEGNPVTLVANGHDLHELRWIEHRIEHYMNITDRPEPGEVEKTHEY